MLVWKYVTAYPRWIDGESRDPEASLAERFFCHNRAKCIELRAYFCYKRFLSSNRLTRLLSVPKSEIKHLLG
jgi:hypothetical protein